MIGEARLIAEYGLIQHLALQAVLPLRMVVTRTRYSDLQGRPITLDYENIHHRNETLFGPGDAQLLAHLADKFGPLLAGVRLGLSFPTGKVNEDPYRLGDEGQPHEHIQFGTGTFDPLVGADLATSVGDTTFGAFSFAQVPLYSGPQGYRAGARFIGGLSISEHIDSRAPSPRMSGIFVREWAEHWHGEVPTEEGNLGRTDVYIGPGLTVPFLGDWSASADVRFRVWHQAESAQLDLPVLIELSVGRLFHLESGSHEEHEAALAGGGDVTDLVRQGEARPLVPVHGKWTVFDFWATWCEACHTVDQGLRDLARDRPDLAVRRVNVVDFDSPIAERELRHVSELPHVRVVNPEGRVVLDESGAAEPILEKIRAAITQKGR